MKFLIAADAFCASLNHNLPFKIYTDSSDYQLGAAMEKREFQSPNILGRYKNQESCSTMEEEILVIIINLIFLDAFGRQINDLYHS